MFSTHARISSFRSFLTLVCISKRVIYLSKIYCTDDFSIPVTLGVSAGATPVFTADLKKVTESMAYMAGVTVNVR